MTMQKSCGHVKMFSTCKSGNYAVFATLRGSCGETSHRMVGQPHVSAERCATAALKAHCERGLADVEIVCLHDGRRVAVKLFVQSN